MVEDKKMMNVLLEKDRHYNNKFYGLGGFSFAKLTSEGLEFQNADFEDEWGNTHWRTYFAYADSPGLYIVDSYKYTTIYRVDKEGNVEEVDSTKKGISKTIEQCKDKIAEYPEGQVYLEGVKKRAQENAEKTWTTDGEENFVIDGEKKYKIYKYKNGDKCIFIENQKIVLKKLVRR